MPTARYKDLCIDAVDAHAAAAFWGGLLGWEAHPHDDGDACLRLGDETVLVWVNAVPEPTTVKNRVHLDVRGSRWRRRSDPEPRWSTSRSGGRS